MRLHSIIISNLYTRFSNSTNYHLSLPRPRTDTFKKGIAFIYTFFQLYELSTQFAQAKERHIPNKYSLYTHVFPPMRTITLVCLGQGQTHSKQVQHLHTRFSNSTNYHLRLPRPRIDTFETSIAFTHTFFPPLRNVNLVRLGQGQTHSKQVQLLQTHFFQLYELLPQFVQTRDRHSQNKHSLLWCLPMEQAPSDSPILSLAQLPQSEHSCTP